MSAQVPSDIILNYSGVVLSLFSIGFYVFVKLEPAKDTKEIRAKIENFNLKSMDIVEDFEPEVKAQKSGDFFDRFSVKSKRIVGFSSSCLAGIMYGVAFTPLIYMGQQENNTNYMDYFFSYYSGIFVTVLFYLALYSSVMKNKPLVYSNVVLPGLISGCMWIAGDVFYFLATGALSQAISFPIAQIGPPVVSALWVFSCTRKLKD